MEYPAAVEKLFKKAGAAIGDTVAVTTRDKRFDGVAMPHHAFSGVDVLTVKLANGYNVGIAVADITKLELVSKQTPTARKTGKIKVLGFDAVQDARKAIESGTMIGSVAQFPSEMGRLAIESAFQVLNGQRPQADQRVKIELVVKSAGAAAK